MPVPAATDQDEDNNTNTNRDKDRDAHGAEVAGAGAGGARSTLAAAAAAAAAEAAEDSEGDGGEWITAANVDLHKTVAAGLVTEGMRAAAAAAGKAAGKAGRKKALSVACMSGDFAVQNVLLAMGVALVSAGGERVRKVKSWMLRCHGCMKLCRDPARKFCPVCGGATLTRVAVTATGKVPGTGSAGAAPGTVAGSAAAMGVRVHLKAGYTPRTRGTVYSLPAPRMGRAGAGPSRGGAGKGEEPILREDQKEWQRALHKDEWAMRKAARRTQKAADAAASATTANAFGLPADGWGTFADLTSTPYMGLPPIGAGRRNPNEKRRARK